MSEHQRGLFSKSIETPLPHRNHINQNNLNYIKSFTEHIEGSTYFVFLVKGGNECKTTFDSRIDMCE